MYDSHSGVFLKAQSMPTDERATCYKLFPSVVNTHQSQHGVTFHRLFSLPTYSLPLETGSQSHCLRFACVERSIVVGRARCLVVLHCEYPPEQWMELFAWYGPRVAFFSP